VKASIWTGYGSPDVLRMGEVEKPVPKDNEVLIKVYAATVTAGDCEMRSLKLPAMIRLPMRFYVGIFKPQRITILGQEYAGVIEAVGSEVKAFQVGDAVFGTTGFSLGTYAEYKCLPANSGDVALARKPGNISFSEAAAVPVGGLEALHFLRQANIQPGERVLINGAGGSIGTIGIQLARYYGAEVTAVDSAEKLEMLRSIGAKHVIDYAAQDFTQTGEMYDVIFDVAGKSPFARSVESLRENGRYLLANPSMADRMRASRPGGTRNQRVIVGSAGQRSEDLEYLKQLIEAGKIKPVIDRYYSLEQVAEAHHYVESGRKKGNVIITIRPDDPV
jgi:NADPH:quinone reductase-like Zn-dependent oxidoreductase